MREVRYVSRSVPQRGSRRLGVETDGIVSKGARGLTYRTPRPTTLWNHSAKPEPNFLKILFLKSVLYP